jgi:hypothetical protein
MLMTIPFLALDAMKEVLKVSRVVEVARQAAEM